jgi:tetratricopeptide (TPR) repeat protein
MVDELTFTSYRSQQVSQEELDRLEALLAESPDDLQVMDWVAFAQYCTGNYDRSIDLYRRCIDREPQTASYYYFLGNALYKKNAKDEAVRNWEMATNLDTVGLFRRKAEEKLAKARSKEL